MTESGGILSMLSVQSEKLSSSQDLFDGLHGPTVVLGWAGFQDLQFIAGSLGTLLLATLLGALIGYHPATKRTIEHLHEADMPHVYVMYAVIGAVIGVAVREFGTVVGVVIFGIGGLIRFRSTTDSTRDTVRLITVTLAGLIAGLGLLHFAVITTLFAFGLIYFFDSRPPCRIKVEGLPKDRTLECADAYRGMLKGQGCKIIAEHRSLQKERIEFVFRLSGHSRRDRLEAALHGIAADLQGDVDLEVG
jgi:hypothetical protein